MPRRLGKPWPDVMLRLLETFSGAPLVSHYFARKVEAARVWVSRADFI
jgi:hypothetical protein